MQYVIKIEGGLPVGDILSADNLRQIVDGLPDGYLTAGLLEEYGYAPFVFTEAPISTPLQYPAQLPPDTKTADGAWLQKWALVDRELSGPELEAAQMRHSKSEKRLAKRRVLERIGTFLAPFTDGYTKEEIASWPTKSIAAAEYLKGTPAAIITNEATERGEDPTGLAQKIVAKSDFYQDVISKTAGLRGKTFDEIDASETANDVWAAVASSQTRASDLASELGLSFE